MGLVINIDEYSDIGTHWVALYVNNNSVTYFDSFGVEPLPKEIKTFINNKTLTKGVFAMQAYDSIICGNVFIYWFYACKKNLNWIYKSILPKQL